MQVKYISAVGNSCNFCDKGSLLGNGSVSRPYDNVVEFTSEGSGKLIARICDCCLTELTEKAVLAKLKTGGSK